MNWVEALRNAIAYMEEHMMETISADQIAAGSGCCPGQLAKGFQIVTGYTFSEYLRNRRMYLAALDLKNEDLKVIEAALKYGYESPDSFTRAFRKFHGFTPNQIQPNKNRIRTFLPLQIQITVQGGHEMNYQIQKIPAFEVIGKLYKVASERDSYQVIPRLWNEFMAQMGPVFNGQDQDLPVSKAIWQNNIGEFGICFEKSEGLEYMIAGKYRGGEVPEGFVVRTIPGLNWAQFNCYGPLPDALQKVNTQIFTQWLPQNPEYSLAYDCSIEYYPLGNGQDPDYKSQIWIPVKKK
ncbi:AraC family transcriptional regulator [Erysipelotrichaceae bacterium RD49]|nr:AraC family transcriptional regulator [Erysipelotrichaceae bacterium RD49]